MLADAQWIWVGTGDGRADPEAENNALVKAIGKGQVILDEVTKRVAAIEKDDKIPVRGKKGVLSKKQTRDEVRLAAGLADGRGAEEGGRRAQGDLPRVGLHHREMVRLQGEDS